MLGRNTISYKNYYPLYPLKSRQYHSWLLHIVWKYVAKTANSEVELSNFCFGWFHYIYSPLSLSEIHAYNIDSYEFQMLGKWAMERGTRPQWISSLNIGLSLFWWVHINGNGSKSKFFQGWCFFWGTAPSSLQKWHGNENPFKMQFYCDKDVQKKLTS